MKLSKWRMAGLVGLVTALFLLCGGEAWAAPECCDAPGAIELCWWEDADRDGAACTQDGDCASGDCDMSGAGTLEWPAGRGLCTCASHDDCGSGVCVSPEGGGDGVCGPSYCNGFKVCTCSGGCVDWDMDPSDDNVRTPFEFCAAQGVVPNCCDFEYPGTPGVEAGQVGYCSNSNACVNCRNDADCVDNNPCTESEGCNATSGLCNSGTPVDCDDGDFCNGIEVCDPTDNDGDPCHASPALVCDDENDCTDDSCDNATGCVYDALDTPDECCMPTVPGTYDDGLQCTDDTCPEPVNPTLGPFSPMHEYHDYNAPNPDLFPGTCCYDSWPDCSDDNACTVDTCCNPVSAADPVCGGVTSWECAYEADLTVPGCCEVPADCTPIACKVASCVDYQCQYANDGSLGAACCDEDADCTSALGPCEAGHCDTNSGQCYYTGPSDPPPPGCCNATNPCFDGDLADCIEPVCCDTWNIVNGIPPECATADPWTCVDAPVHGSVGCCDDDSDCVSANPCLAGTCGAVNPNECSYDVRPDTDPEFSDYNCCVNPGGVDDVYCQEASDTNNCTTNNCNADYTCSNTPTAPTPAGCCTGATVDSDCNPLNNDCLQAYCDIYNNCQVSVFNASSECCAVVADCPAPGGTRPCLESRDCDLTGDELSNANYGHCVLAAFVDGTECDSGDACYSKLCDDQATEEASNFRCDTFDFEPANPQTACTVGNPDPCLDYFCDGAGGCTQTVSIASTSTNQDCATSSYMTVPVTFEDDSSCASELYTVSSTGFGDRFNGACAGAAKADLVYNYDDQTGNEYELTHKVVEVVPDPNDQPMVNWDPIIYTEIDCGDNTTQYTCNDDCGFGGTNYNTGDYGVASLLGECDPGVLGDTALSVGPWPVTDMPDYVLGSGVGDDFDENNIHDGYTLGNVKNVTVMVDSQDTAENGGEFEFTADEESHNNNDCYNTASYVAAPIIDGVFDWKQRWRGEITAAYKNVFWAADPTEGLGYNGVISADNPRQAFFKFELEAGSGRYLTYVDPYALYKIKESGYAATIMDIDTRNGNFGPMALSRVEPDGDTCGVAVAPEISSLNMPPYMQGIIIDAGLTQQEGYLAVINQSSVGDYELNVVKEQPAFFGLMDSYQEQTSCQRASEFEGEGHRVDWVPNGSMENGYMVVVNDLGTTPPDTCPSGDVSGWLVSPTCYEAVLGALWTDFGGHRGGNFAEWIELPFRFPIGDQFANMLYLDTSGRILPREGVGSCTDDGDCTVGSYDYCACDARIGGGTCGGTGKCVRGDPRGIDDDPNMKEFFAPPSAGGYAPVIAAAWGGLQPVWDRPSDGAGYLTGQTVVFEGTTAYVLSWVGYDANNDLSKWFHDTYEEHLNYQIILRSDGRIAFYYHYVPSGDSNGWTEVLSSKGSFMMGVSGGLAMIDCVDGDTGHTQCSTAYGGEADCDNESYSESGYSYTPTYRCIRQMPGVLGSDGLGNE
ncbi:MAG: hypothetical protein GY762_13995 [Proteobacteria bacterium]|nr:hypothetical protein [Pseudomonadota bacterium]